jgi:hypothetical protein
MMTTEAQMELVRQRQADLRKSAENGRVPKTTLPWWRRRDR